MKTPDRARVSYQCHNRPLAICPDVPNYKAIRHLKLFYVLYYKSYSNCIENLKVTLDCLIVRSRHDASFVKLHARNATRVTLKSPHVALAPQPVSM